LLEYKLHACRLPQLRRNSSSSTLTNALGERRLRFIGDSVSLQHFNFVRGCVLGCSSGEGVVEGSDWMAQLQAANHSKKAAERAIGFVMWWGAQWRSAACTHRGGGRIDARRLDELPREGSGVIAAAMHLLLYLGPAGSALGYDDVVVLNFGLHFWTNLDAQMSEMLAWWRAERAARRAPRLLWRETSAQHFAGYGGLYSCSQAKWTSQEHVERFACSGADAARNVEPRHTLQCRTLAHEEAAATYRADRGALAVWRLALPESSDSSWVGVLPTFWPTVPLEEEHPLQFWYWTPARQPGHGVLQNGSCLPDCTHYCNPGSALRVWTQMLVSHVRAWKRDGSLRSQL
jgi:hypothetical protein